MTTSASSPTARRARAGVAAAAICALAGSALVGLVSATGAEAAASAVYVDASSKTAVTAPDGRVFAAESGFVGGRNGTVTTKTITGALGQKILASNHIGMSSWSAPVVNGTYDVTVAMNEYYWSAAGKRVFSAKAEGVTMFTNLDVFAAVGARKQLDKTVRVTVADGKIDLSWTASKDLAMVSAISVVPVVSATTSPPATPTSATPTITPSSTPTSAAPTASPSTATPTVAPTTATPSTSTSSPAASATPTATPTKAPTGGKLTWAPPALSSPITKDLTGVTGAISLSAGQDYILKLPADAVWKNGNGLNVKGGRNVVIIGGKVDVGNGVSCGSVGTGCPADLMLKRAAYFNGQTGTVFLEGVRFFSSAGKLTEGINVSAPLAKVIVQNVALDTTLVGTKDANHADCLQVWNGPTSLKVDGFTCTTGYQGMFLNPHDTSTASVIVEDWELKNVSIVGNSLAKYILWKVAPPAGIKTTNVWTSGGSGNWKASTDWPSVTTGLAPANFTASAGLGYVTPGYAS